MNDLIKISKNLLVAIGEDCNREGLKETPERMEKAWKFWTSGYKKNVKDVMKYFSCNNNDQMIIVKAIDYYSHCEHHLAPFYGQVHIGYIPNNRVLGVSKFARLIEIYARRLQIQERLTQQIADSIMKYLKPKGVGVIVEGIHLCMRSRGVEKQNTKMITSVMRGNFRKNSDTRNEFLKIINIK
jgi:GTP cyclohydrolase I